MPCVILTLKETLHTHTHACMHSIMAKKSEARCNDESSNNNNDNDDDDNDNDNNDNDNNYIHHDIKHNHACGSLSWLLYIYIPYRILCHVPTESSYQQWRQPDLRGPFLVCHQSMKVVCVHIDKYKYGKQCQVLKYSRWLHNRKKIGSVLIPRHAIQILCTPTNIKTDSVFHVFVCALDEKIHASLDRIYDW